MPERANNPHRVRGGDDDIEIKLPALDSLRQIFKANNVGAGCLGLLGFFALRENRNPHGFAGTGRHHDRTTNCLVGFFRIDAEHDRDIDRFVELRRRGVLGERKRISQGIIPGAVDLGFERLQTLGLDGHVRLLPQ